MKRFMLVFAVAVVSAGAISQTERIARGNPVATLPTASELRVGKDGRVSVIVYLKHQPYAGIAQQVKAARMPDLIALKNQVADIHRRHVVGTLGQETPLSPDEKALADAAGARVRQGTVDLRAEIIRQGTEATAAEQATLAAAVTALGGSVSYHYRVFNALAVRLRADQITALANDPLVERIAADHLMTGDLKYSTHSMNVDAFWNNGCTGNYGSDVAIVDCGVYWQNPALAAHTHVDAVFHATASQEQYYDDNPGDPDDYADHGTTVAGTIWSQGCHVPGKVDWSDYKGMAYANNNCINAKAGYRGEHEYAYMNWSDMMAAAEWASQQGAQVVNVSYGDTINTRDGDDNVISVFADALVDYEGISWTGSAGNRWPSVGNQQQLSSPGCATNAICVGAMKDEGDVVRDNDGRSSFSSAGPTVGGRRKPDLMAVGGDAYPSLLTTTNYSAGGGMMTPTAGTSLAAPQVAGAIALLADATMDALGSLESKAVLLNSADDWGDPGWDRYYGWGYMNLANAYAQRWDFYDGSVEVRSNGLLGRRNVFWGMLNAGDKVTLVWNCHFGWGLTKLALLVYRASDYQLLYSSATAVDNVQQIVATATDDVLICVEPQDCPQQDHLESYAIALPSWFEETQAGPQHFQKVMLPWQAGQPVGARFLAAQPIYATTPFPLRNVTCHLTLPPQAVLLQGANPAHFDLILPGDSASAMWYVAVNDSGTFGFRVDDSASICSETVAETVADTVLVGNAVILTRGSGGTGQPIPISMSVTNFDSLSRITVPLKYDPAALRLDSVRDNLSQLPSGWSDSVVINQPAGKALIVLKGPTPLPNGTRTLSVLAFSVYSGAQPQTAVIDSSTYGGSSLTLTKWGTGAALHPPCRPGAIFVADMTPPSAPSLRLPADNAWVTTRRPRLTWSQTAGPGGSYSVQWDSLSGFPSPGGAFCYDTSYTVQDWVPLAERTWFWRVLAEDSSHNQSGFSPARSFTIDATPPATPRPITPASGAIISENPPIFSWTSSSEPGGGITYSLQYSLNPGFQAQVTTVSVDTNVYRPDSQLKAGVPCYWRVEAIDRAGNRSGFLGEPCRFRILSQSSWFSLAAMPVGPKNRRVKDGGCLAYCDIGSSGLVYALKGNNSYEFYEYDIGSDAWHTLDSIPAYGTAHKKKTVKKGATLACGTGHLFAAKGNSSLEFWEYLLNRPGELPESATSYIWVQRPDIPAGAKTLREGAGSCIVPSVHGDSVYVYLLKGSGTYEFYRYDVEAGLWHTMASAPAGTSGKPFKNGSCICYDGDSLIYALKTSYNELSAYNLNTGLWTARAQLPFAGSTGRKKKVKDGAGMAVLYGRLYALKGGNTLEFWCYESDSNRWSEAQMMPAGPAGRNVKGGGGLTAGLDQLLALKGNNTLELWTFVPIPPTGKLPGEDMMGQVWDVPATVSLQVAPDPATGVAWIRYALPSAGKASLRLYDMSGRVAQRLAEGWRSAGRYTLQLDSRRLARGVYILKLDAGTSNMTRKLVLE